MTTESKRIHLALVCAALTMLSTSNRVVLVSSFAVQPQPPYQQQQQQQQQHSVKRYASPPFPTNTGDDDTEEDEPSLVIGSDTIAKEMQTVKQAGDYDFGQIDFLALAKQRAQDKPASQNNVGTDADWTTLAAQKKEQFGEIDDWENSQKEDGNADSQILMFSDPPPSSSSGDGDGDGDNNEDDEPKLLLF